MFEGDARRAATREGDPAHALYLGDVRRTDAAIERLLAAVGEDTVVVLASDHGESFGEHGELSHGPLCHASTIDALLAIRAPGFARGRSDSGLRSVTDIAPTLRRLCGLEEVASDGRDLAGAPHATVVSESLFTWRVHGWGQCFAVTDGEHTLVESGPGVELFDRRADPGETHPLPLSLRAYEKLDRALAAFRSRRSPAHDGELLASMPAYGQTRRDVTGYLPRHENAALADPRPHLAAWMAVQEIPWIVRMAVERRTSAPLEAALRMLADFGRAAAKSPLVPFHRARVCEAMAEVTGEPSWLEVAASAQLEAVQKGYTGKDQIRQAITCAVAAGDGVVLRSLTSFLRSGGGKLDAELEQQLAKASLAIERHGNERRFAMRPRGR